MNEELILKAKQCKSAEELMALAKENGIILTAEQAEEKYNILHAEGEVQDEELDSVAGGFSLCDPPSETSKSGKPYVNQYEDVCTNYACAYCGKSDIDANGMHKSCGMSLKAMCYNCKHRGTEGIWTVCTHPLNKKTTAKA